MSLDKLFKFQKKMITRKFIKHTAAFFAVLVLFSLLLLGIHAYIIHHFFSDKIFSLPLWSIYLFHFTTVFIVFGISSWMATTQPGKVFTVFMAATLVKMLLALVFLLPILINKGPSPTADVLNFFIPYFVFLALEVFSVVYFLMRK